MLIRQLEAYCRLGISAQIALGGNLEHEQTAEAAYCTVGKIVTAMIFPFVWLWSVFKKNTPLPRGIQSLLRTEMLVLMAVGLPGWISVKVKVEVRSMNPLRNLGMDFNPNPTFWFVPFTGTVCPTQKAP